MGKQKYLIFDKCKTIGSEYSVRVKGYCVNCYINSFEKQIIRMVWNCRLDRE